MVELFEYVHFKLSNSEKGKLDSQTSSGIWLGKSLNSDKHLIAPEKGVRRCRSIWRMPEKKRWNVKAFEQWTGLPWQTRGQATPMPGTPALPSPGTPVLQHLEGAKEVCTPQSGNRSNMDQRPGCHCSDDNPQTS